MLDNDGQTMLVRSKGDCFTVHFLCVTFHFSLLNSKKTAGRTRVRPHCTSNANERGMQLQPVIKPPKLDLKCAGILHIYAFLSKFAQFFWLQWLIFACNSTLTCAGWIMQMKKEILVNHSLVY